MICCYQCNKTFENNRKLSKHIRDQHSTIKEYYIKFISKPQKCNYCDNEAEFIGLSGYKKTCKLHFLKLRSDSAKTFRTNLKCEEIKFKKFKNNVANNMKNIWLKREKEEKQRISNKISDTLVFNNSKLSSLERKKKYSRYYKCDNKTIKRLNKNGAKILMNSDNGYGKTLKGRFKPKNPQKYKGDVTNIIYRSSYELKFMHYLDRHPDIIEWGSEEVIIPYKSPVDGKYHRYFTDFFVVKINKDGSREKLIIEIKPFKQTIPPEVKKRKTKQYLFEVQTYMVNDAKWKYAKKYCDERGWKFQILTEKELNIKQ